MVYSGHQTFVLVGQETTFNTEATAITSNVGFIENSNSSMNNNTLQIRTLGSRQVEDNVPGVFDSTLSIDGHLNSGAILEMFFVQSNDVETPWDYKHTFIDTSGTPSTLPCSLPSYSFQENMTCSSDIVLTHTGCKVNTCEVTLETNNTLRFSSEIITTNVTKSTTAGTRTITTTKPMGSFQGNISLADTGSGYTAVGLPSTFSVSKNNNIEPSDVKTLSSRENQDLVPKILEITVNFTQKFANSVEFEQFLGGTTAGDTITNTDIKVEVTNGVILGSGRVEYYIELSNGQLETCEINKSYDGVIEATYNYVGGKIKKHYFVDAVASYF